MRLKERGFRRLRPATLAGLPENGQEVSIEDARGRCQRVYPIASARQRQPVILANRLRELPGTANRLRELPGTANRLRQLPVRRDVSHFVTTYSNRWRN